MNQREITAEARFRAGLIVQAVLSEGWSGQDDVVHQYGDADAERIGAAMSELADTLANTPKPARRSR